MLKYLLSTAAYTALDDGQKALYKSGDKDGEYVLNVTGLPEPEDTGPIKRALQAEKDAHKETKSKRDEYKTKLDGMPDVEKLKADHVAETAKLSKFVDSTLKDSVAMAIASKISTAPALLAPKIAERISVDMSGDTPKTVFLGADGKPDATLTVDKVSGEFASNKDYKAIIIASKASGGGAPVQPLVKPLGGGAPQDGDKVFDASSAAPADLAARITARKEAEQSAT